MKIITPKPEIISVVSYSGINTQLIDKRIRTGGIYFGTIGDVAKNLGLNVKETNDSVIYSGNRDCVQKFVEKLHFSGIGYREL